MTKSYREYQKTRNAVWKLIIDLQIGALPVRISQVLKALEIPFGMYQSNRTLLEKLKLLGAVKNMDGLTVRLKDGYHILYDGSKPPKRIRFTLAHELGHIIEENGFERHDGLLYTARNREPAEGDRPAETKANIFASRLLAPACVLHETKRLSAEAIMEICDISYTCASFRADRMAELEERNERFLRERDKGCFYLDPLETQVRMLFQAYIDSLN